MSGQTDDRMTAAELNELRALLLKFASAYADIAPREVETTYGWAVLQAESETQRERAR